MIIIVINRCKCIGGFYATSVTESKERYFPTHSNLYGGESQQSSKK